MSVFQFNKDKTIRPLKAFKQDSLRFQLHKKAQASLGTGTSLKHAVALPPGENFNDWLAVHTVDFFNRVNVISGCFSDFCDTKSCPIMTAGKLYEFMWKDDKNFRKPTSMPASQYIHVLLEWVELQINSEDIFPSRTDVPFPKNFQNICAKIFRRLYRIFAHIFYHHFEAMQEMGAEAHVNTCYKHFIYFALEFKLIPEKELDPLRELTKRLCHE